MLLVRGACPLCKKYQDIELQTDLKDLSKLPVYACEREVTHKCVCLTHET